MPQYGDQSQGGANDDTDEGDKEEAMEEQKLPLCR